MRIPKNTLPSKIAFYHAKAAIWKPALGGVGILLNKLTRKMYTSRTEVFFGVPVYFIENKHDFAIVWSWLENSAALLTPYWTKQIKEAFKSIMIQDFGPVIKYDQKEKCWMINAIKLKNFRGRKPVIMLTQNLIAALCVGYLYQGRFGYFGVKNSNSITYRAMARTLRKCDMNGDCYDELAWCYEKIDSVRPDRYYSKRFIIEQRLKSRRASAVKVTE